jgi:hypothetical protein
MDDQARQFRQAAQKHNRGRSGRGIRYPRELHQEAVAYARLCRQDGASLVSVATELGIKPITLSRWLRETHRPGLRKVEFVAAGSKSATQIPPAPLWVTMPSGIRIEGLDLEALLTLLRQLG